jgi:hypothetical protein
MSLQGISRITSDNKLGGIENAIHNTFPKLKLKYDD